MFRVLVATFFIVNGFAEESTTQGVCVPDSVVVRSIRGQVVSQSTSGEHLVSKASIKLRRDYYGSPTIAEKEADSQGRFQFTGLRPGKYKLSVGFPGLIDLTFPVVVRPLKSTRLQQDIVISLGLDSAYPAVEDSRRFESANLISGRARADSKSRAVIYGRPDDPQRRSRQQAQYL